MSEEIPGQQLLRHAAHSLGSLAEAIAVVIIAAAVFGALWQLGGGVLARTSSHTEVRLNLGRSLTLALEFMLAADVVRTAVAPT